MYQKPLNNLKPVGRLLPDQFQCELNLPRRGLSRSNQTSTGSGASRLFEDNAIIDRRSEVGAVEYIEKLCPKLDVKILRDPPDTGVLKQGKIQVGEAGPNNRVAAQVAPQVGWIRKGQALRPDVVIGIAGIGECLAARTCHPIRRLGSLVELHPQRIPAQDRGERLTARSLENAAQLPSA